MSDEPDPYEGYAKRPSVDPLLVSYFNLIEVVVEESGLTAEAYAVEHGWMHVWMILDGVFVTGEIVPNYLGYNLVVRQMLQVGIDDEDLAPQEVVTDRKSDEDRYGYLVNVTMFYPGIPRPVNIPVIRLKLSNVSAWSYGHAVLEDADQSSPGRL